MTDRTRSNKASAINRLAVAQAATGKGWLNWLETKAGFYFLLLLAVLAPLPFGSNRPWAWNACALGIAMVAIHWGLTSVLSSRKVSRSFPPFMIFMFSLVLIWVWIQQQSWVPAGWGHPLWGMAGDQLDMDLPAFISLTPDNTQTALIRLLSYGLMLFLTYQYTRDRRNAVIALKWLAFAAAGYAAYGLIIHFGEFNSILWYEKTAYQEDVTSTFINRNSYATYAGLGLLCLLTLFLHRTETNVNGLAQLGKAGRIEQILVHGWPLLFAILLVTTALISTHSRGGFISTGIAVLVLLLVYVTRQRMSLWKILLLLALLVSMLGFVYSLSSEPLLKRLNQMTGDSETRIEVYQATARGIADNPVLGFGYGSYQSAFSLYRDEQTSRIFDKAHNTYLELMFELGVPATAGLLLIMVFAFVLLIRGVVQRRRDWLYPAMGISASVLVGVHGLVDFSLQIPAVAMQFSAMMGIALAQSHSSQHKPHHH